MPTLTNEAKRSMKVSGGYQCKAPSVPFRFVVCDDIAVASYNKLYMMGFVRALNEGCKVWRTEAGLVTTSCMTWVKAEAHISTDNDSDFDNVADVYMVIRDEWKFVGYLVRQNSKSARLGYDFTSETSDELGFWHAPGTPFENTVAYRKYGVGRTENDVNDIVCHDEDGHDGEECTCT